MSESISPTVEFISLAKEFRHEYVVEKSRFITTVYPCKTEEEAASIKNSGMRAITVQPMH